MSWFSEQINSVITQYLQNFRQSNLSSICGNHRRVCVTNHSTSLKKFRPLSQTVGSVKLQKYSDLPLDNGQS